MTTPTVQKPALKLSTAGLTKPGVVVLQTLCISFFSLIELVFRHGVGILTGLAICFATFGGNRLGRKGTAYVAVVTPPLAFAGFIAIAIVAIDGLHPSRVGLDFIASLAGTAPYLIVSALYGWYVFFDATKKKR